MDDLQSDKTVRVQDTYLYTEEDNGKEDKRRNDGLQACMEGKYTTAFVRRLSPKPSIEIIGSYDGRGAAVGRGLGVGVSLGVGLGEGTANAYTLLSPAT